MQHVYKLTRERRSGALGALPIQLNGDRIRRELPFLALSAEMAALPVGKERDAPASAGIFTRLFACLDARHSLRRRAQVPFAIVGIAFSVVESVYPCEFPSCGCHEW